MTFHAPRSRGHILALVTKRLLLNRTAVVAVGALISTSVVLAGRGEEKPVGMIQGSILHDDSLVLQQLALPKSTASFESSETGSVTAVRKPATLESVINADEIDLPETNEPKSTSRSFEAPERAIPSYGDSFSPEIVAILDEDTPEIAAPPRMVDVAMLEPAPELDFYREEIEARFPEFGPVSIVPAVARAPDLIQEPALDFLTSDPFVITLTAEEGESLDGLMERAGMTAEDRLTTLVALRADSVDETMTDGDIVDLAFLGKNDRDLLGIRLRQLGQLPVELRWDEETANLWAGLDPLYEVLNDTDDGSATTLSVTGKPNDTILMAGAINSSLYQSAKKAGLTPRQTKALEDIFRYSVDFQRDLRKGDHFEALFERGENGAHGAILYAKLTNRGSEIALYRGTDDLTGEVGYFDATGKTNKRSLMRTPVAGARISSHFGMRHHPILGYNKMHRGTDFAAARGTPIFAAGDGIIDYLGRNGAYGKYIRIRHNGVYETAYAHMSRYATGLVSGSRVRQGDVIGYVGSTGRSTGPHLHFEIIESGQRINPMKIADFGPVRGLSGGGLASFLVRVSRIEVALSLMRDDVRVADVD